MSDRIVYKLNGQRVSREQFFEHAKKNKDWLSKPAMTSNTYTEHNPLISDGCGVMKDQVGEAREMITKHSIQGAQVLDSGQIRFTSRRARKEFLQRRGLNDQDAGFGD